MSERSVKLDDGKYEFYIPYGQGSLRCKRYGEQWREFVGDKAVRSLFDEVLRLRELAVAAEARVVAIARAAKLVVDLDNDAHPGLHTWVDLRTKAHKQLEAALKGKT
jgi:hypothetical protein